MNIYLLFKFFAQQKNSFLKMYQKRVFYYFLLKSGI
ncbi:hypothetical protein Q787_02950 [Ornithobacterium rhinotracheale H06-030791]|nr:hypothetical protein Q785_03100 [Ornithobacterium rhinotracheale ORT-UMN 88]KGB67226.1 hypothetical protein Q787_02950 [Ornithobacterium rhinotracheale H06-030791]